MQAQGLKPLTTPAATIYLPQFNPAIQNLIQPKGQRGLLMTICAPSIAEQAQYIAIIDKIEYSVDSDFLMQTPTNWITKISVVKKATDSESKISIEFKRQKERTVLRLLKKRDRKEGF